MKEFSIDSFRIKDLLIAINSTSGSGYYASNCTPNIRMCTRLRGALFKPLEYVAICVNGSRELYPSKNKRKKMDNVGIWHYSALSLVYNSIVRFFSSCKPSVTHISQ